MSCEFISGGQWYQSFQNKMKCYHPRQFNKSKSHLLTINHLLHTVELNDMTPATTTYKLLLSDTI